MKRAGWAGTPFAIGFDVTLGSAHADHGSNAQTGGRLNLLLSDAGWRDESWADRLPALLKPMGVEALRARTGREATETIRTHRIHIAVVDLGLPIDLCEPGAAAGGAAGSGMGEGGVRLLELLRRLENPPPTVVLRRARTQRDAAREIASALRLGAFSVVDPPTDSAGIERMLEALRRVLQRHYENRWPGGCSTS